MQRGRIGQWLASRECSGLFENPWIVDGPTSDGDAVDTGLLDHVQTVLRGEQIAATQNDVVARVGFDFF